MNKRLLALLMTAVLCLCRLPALAEEDAGTDFRRLPGYTCFPLIADNEEHPGRFCLDAPMEWDGGDNSAFYEVPTVIAIDPDNQGHVVLVSELGMIDQALILIDSEHPLSGFLLEGLSVTHGESTDNSRILETFDLYGLPATRVDMVGQGFEMIWILDPDDFIGRNNELGVHGDLWFFMYPTDPDDAEYTRIVSGMVDSFTVSGKYGTIPADLGAAPASDFDYTVSGDEVCLNAYLGSSAYVLVPDEIEGKPVTALGDSVFYEKDVRGVSLPDTVREMGHHTFGGCTSLVYAHMPDALEILPAGTFESCYRLVDPGIADGQLKKIEFTAFWGNQYLTELQLPESLEEINDNSFVMCDYLGYIHVPEKNGHFLGNGDGTVLLSADGETLIWYSFMNPDKEYVVPAGVKQICANAFRRAPLTAVVLPDGLETISYGAFSATEITELRVPESVTEIGVMQNVYVEDSDQMTTARFLSIGESLQTIRGVPGSAAEKYAEFQKLAFIPEEQDTAE